jgi:hypothetical protein
MEEEFGWKVTSIVAAVMTLFFTIAALGLSSAHDISDKPLFYVPVRVENFSDADLRKLHLEILEEMNKRELIRSE